MHFCISPPDVAQTPQSVNMKERDDNGNEWEDHVSHYLSLQQSENRQSEAEGTKDGAEENI